MKKPFIIVGASLVLIAAFIAGSYAYKSQQTRELGQLASTVASQPDSQGSTAFTRPNSPSLGSVMSRVQIMEFFDPACESCRAFYPVVKDIMKESKGGTRLTLRYAIFHDGSEYVAKVLEAARMQGQDIYWKSLEAALDAQPRWASHGSPQPDLVWEALKNTGLDIERARREMDDPRIAALLKQDAEDIAALNVRQTPTFFINGKPLRTMGEAGLRDQVQSELAAQTR